MAQSALGKNNETKNKFVISRKRFALKCQLIPSLARSVS
jgi:hypothetical protein